MTPWAAELVKLSGAAEDVALELGATGVGGAGAYVAVKGSRKGAVRLGRSVTKGRGVTLGPRALSEIRKELGARKGVRYFWIPKSSGGAYAHKGAFKRGPLSRKAVILSPTIGTGGRPLLTRSGEIIAHELGHHSLARRKGLTRTIHMARIPTSGRKAKRAISR